MSSGERRRHGMSAPVSQLYMVAAAAEPSAQPSLHSFTLSHAKARKGPTQFLQPQGSRSGTARAAVQRPLSPAPADPGADPGLAPAGSRPCILPPSHLPFSVAPRRRRRSLRDQGACLSLHRLSLSCALLFAAVIRSDSAVARQERNAPAARDCAGRRYIPACPTAKRH